jgi:hypothetical protein
MSELDDRLSKAQLVLRDGRHDNLSRAVAEARDVLNGVTCTPELHIFDTGSINCRCRKKTTRLVQSHMGAVTCITRVVSHLQEKLSAFGDEAFCIGEFVTAYRALRKVRPTGDLRIYLSVQEDE